MNRNENSVSNLLDNRASEENITLTQIQPKLTLLRKEVSIIFVIVIFETAEC